MNIYISLMKGHMNLFAFKLHKQERFKSSSVAAIFSKVL